MYIQEVLNRSSAAVHDWINWLTTRATDVAGNVEHRLHGKPYLALQNVSCSYHDGVVTLHGQSPTSALKRIAEALAYRVQGVEHVENEIDVVIGCAESRAGGRRRFDESRR